MSRREVWQRFAPLGAAALAVACLSGCATHQSGNLRPSTAATAEGAAAVRLVPARTDAASLEQTDPGLADALRRAGADPTAYHLRVVAAAYMRVGVPDQALEYFDRALGLEPGDAVSYEGRARVWRDWGLIDLALGDSYRAVHYAPRSPSARNTLGTILQSIGHAADARAAYERALALDPGAAYALSNLCYVTFLEGNASRAGELCRQALAIQPDLAQARTNLAVVVAATGTIDDVREVLAPAAGAAREYTLGVALASNSRFGEAADAFERAAAMDSAFRGALAAARRARLLVGTSGPWRPE